MSISFTKLFSSITESTIWVEPDHVRVTWITMLAMADRRGRVWASIPGLANRAHVSLENCLDALNRFMSPDKYSRTPDNEGRRIEPIDGGWRLLNYDKYRAIRDDETIKESKRNYINARRSKDAKDVENVEQCRPLSTQAEAEAEAEADLGISERSIQPFQKNTFQLRAEKLHGKRISTPWDRAEQLAWKTAAPCVEATSEAEWACIEAFYAAPQEETFARKSLSVTLNNWSGEVAKAVAWKAGQSQFAGAF